jgi:HCO3- transporter family
MCPIYRFMPGLVFGSFSIANWRQFFDVTRIVRLATRFTDEAFTLLIVSIFIMDAVGVPFSNVGILRYYMPDHPTHLGQDEDYDYMTVALLSTILGFGTTAIIFFFRSFKTHPPTFAIKRSARRFTTLLLWQRSLLPRAFPPFCLDRQIQIEQLAVPDKFEPTFQCCDSTCLTLWPDDCSGQAAPARARPWLADFGDLNGKNWVPIAAAGPAMLAILLVFLDITRHLI